MARLIDKSSNGMLHTLLGLGTREDLEGHPKVRASWGKGSSCGARLGLVPRRRSPGRLMRAQSSISWSSAGGTNSGTPESEVWAGLEAWHQVYEGLSDEEVAEVKAMIRSRFSRDKR